MAGSELSKIVTDHGKAARELAAALRAHRARVSERMQALLAPVVGKGETVPDAGFLLELLARRIERAMGEMEAADKAHTDELSDDATPRRRRDNAMEELRAVLLDVKRTLQALFGEEAAATFKLPAELSRDPAIVQRTGADVASALGKKKLPKPVFQGIKKVNTDPWIDSIKKPLKRLESASKDVAREAGEAQVTLGAKSRALDAFEATFGAAAALGWGLLVAVGEKEHAARISMSPRRSRGKGSAEEADGAEASEGSTKGKPE